MKLLYHSNLDTGNILHSYFLKSGQDFLIVNFEENIYKFNHLSMVTTHIWP